MGDIVWLEGFGEREKKLIAFARNYEENYKEAGAPGHNTYLVIAQMARLLDELEAREAEEAVAVLGQPEIDYSKGTISIPVISVGKPGR